MSANTTTTAKTYSFSGRYAESQEHLFKQVQALFDVSADVAYLFVTQAASDAGIALKNSKATFKVGKANKDNKASIKEAVDAAKGVYMTNALNLVHTIQWIDEAQKHGVSYGNTQWELVEPLQQYLALLSAKVKAKRDEDTEAAKSDAAATNK